ncbi:hypothetical protein WN55_05289 [Dufourea novaeangliae]|uniref:Cilia- and flagella-associated protein 157 n=1 Tax=Dufourea novaeangliae TaxID=178035 RepID=A0A154NXY6_DUFNO|nr:hypothetical protein WN55_05289 [Dufourea novaeangliae]
MVDLQGKEKGNISLPLELQSYENEQERNKPIIINMQKAFYNVKISDIENRINRLKDRNDELSEEIETTDDLIFAADTETADEIANLTKLVKSQNNRIETLKNQINTLENNRIQDKETHENNVELFKHKYLEKKVELVSQIKVLNAKINVLEEFKKRQSALEEKLEANKQRMIEYEKEVKEILENIRRKNTTVGHEKNISEQCSNIKRNIVTTKIHNSVLKKLQNKYNEMKERLSIMNIPDSETENKQRLAIENAKTEECITRLRLSKMQTLLHKENTKIGIAKYLDRRVECKIKAIVEALYDVKYIVSCLLKHPPTTESSYVKLLLLLRHRISKGQSKLRCSTVKSVESVLRETECRAQDLKEIPDDIDLETLSESEDTKLSCRAILDERKSSGGEEGAIEISVKSSTFDNELNEIFEDSMLFDIEEHEFVKEVEYVDDEELLNEANEE